MAERGAVGGHPGAGDRPPGTIYEKHFSQTKKNRNIKTASIQNQGSLLRAFRRRSSLLSSVRSGRPLDSGEFFLWCVLFTFEEAPGGLESDYGPEDAVRNILFFFKKNVSVGK